MIHGMFKAEKSDSSKWMIGLAERNIVSPKKPCWIIDHDKVTMQCMHNWL